MKVGDGLVRGGMDVRLGGRGRGGGGESVMLCRWGGTSEDVLSSVERRPGWEMVQIFSGGNAGYGWLDCE